MAEAKKTNYGNESISSLKGADRVRKRPALCRFGAKKARLKKIRKLPKKQDFCGCEAYI